MGTEQRSQLNVFLGIEHVTPNSKSNDRNIFCWYSYPGSMELSSDRVDDSFPIEPVYEHEQGDLSIS